MATFHWTCPYCDRDTTINDERYTKESIDLTINNAEGSQNLGWLFVVCPSPECRKFSLQIILKPYEMEQLAPGRYSRKYLEKKTKTWQLIPSSDAKPMPDYIPRPVVEDYYEACSIKILSPKAAATLARRCLQGMIRDFWGISKSRLIDEIEALEEKVEPEVWEAIDAMRRIGNIGAHMERDINIIVEVDPDEAGKLIALIELLVKEWYVARHNRQRRVKAVVELAAVKQAQKDSN